MKVVFLTSVSASELYKEGLPLPLILVPTILYSNTLNPTEEETEKEDETYLTDI